MFNNKNKLLCCLCMVLLSTAAADTYAGPFAKGSSRAAVVVGSGYTLDENYVILGLGPR